MLGVLLAGVIILIALSLGQSFLLWWINAAIAKAPTFGVSRDSMSRSYDPERPNADVDAEPRKKHKLL